MAERSRALPEGYARFAEGSWTFDDVEERLIEAWGFLRRMPDREAGWLRPSIMSLWQQVSMTAEERAAAYQIDGDDYDRDVLPRPPGLRSVEVDRMEEALNWLRHVPERDRRLVGFAIERLERGEARVPWRDLMRPMGVVRGEHGLRKRYSRAIAAIAGALNMAENRATTVSTV
jgi:hypothetical protein